jgi:hypothetical protein
MPFTVHHAGPVREIDFEAYARLLRKSGADLGKLPRVPDPAGRRWLSVWQTKTEAEAFASELKKRSGNAGWEVAEVRGPVSEGPLGPAVIQLSRRADGLLFALQNLSRVMVFSAYPHARKATRASYLFMNLEDLSDYQAAHRGMGDLLQLVAPALTGLNHEELAEVGYSVVDDDSNETVYEVPSAVPKVA